MSATAAAAGAAIAAAVANARTATPPASPYDAPDGGPAAGGGGDGAAGTGAGKGSAARPPLDAATVRPDFPVLHQQVHGKPLVYLDNAATMQKPRAVLDAELHFYERDNANVHRGVHLLSQRATAAYEAAREKVRRFIGARQAREIVFLRGTTEAVNLVAQTFGRARVAAGDEIVVSGLEHHSNIVPWQLLCQEKGARLRVAPIDDAGAVSAESVAAALSERTRLVAVAHVSNALGTVLPVADIVKLAHARGVPVLLDGAQAVAHLAVDVAALGCDFYAFSGHKACGPTGIGVLYGRAELLAALPPWQGGGEMIRSVSFEKTTFQDIPARFEAGTPNIAGAVALGAALDYLEGLGLDRIAAAEAALLEHATRALGALPGVRLVGTAPHKSAIVSFVTAGVHPHDLGTALDLEGVAIRTGHHCAQPVMERFGIPATSRASFAFYNTHAEVDALVAAVRQAQELLGGTGGALT
ncbi:MAG TPA: cysteine desulfurase [Myxococcota bacterium]|jgi:cysteine desulfurase/selenocysteine lyase|nr:cysteine desulfurase [Myxococcota bacterium]